MAEPEGVWVLVTRKDLLSHAELGLSHVDAFDIGKPMNLTDPLIVVVLAVSSERLSVWKIPRSTGKYREFC